MALNPTALKNVAREMIREEPEQLGRVETVASITTTTVVVTEMAFGNLSEQLTEGYWMTRRDTATAADRVRNVTEFASATGTNTHAGTNYADTTATGEEVELTIPSPRSIDQAINNTLRDFKRLDITTIPGLSNKGRQWLQDLPWIENPGDIYKITRNGSPRISRNAYFEKANAYSSGALTADYWVQAGAAGTNTRSTTPYDTNSLRDGRKYGWSITRAGTNTTFTQVVGLLFGGVDATSLQGETVTVWGRCISGAASSLRMFVNDGVTTTYSDYHTGGSGIEELSKAVTLSSAATTLTFGFSLETDETAELLRGELLDSSSVEDGHRADNYPEVEVYYNGGDQSGADLPVDLPTIGRGAQYVVYSGRPYPQFTQSRITAGTADADVTDAPLDILFRGALAKLFRGMAGANNEDTTRYQQLAQIYKDEYDTVARDHLNIPQSSEIPLSRRRSLAAAPRR